MIFIISCRIDGVSDSHNLPEDDQASLKVVFLLILFSGFKISSTAKHSQFGKWFICNGMSHANATVSWWAY